VGGSRWFSLRRDQISGRAARDGPRKRLPVRRLAAVGTALGCTPRAAWSPQVPTLRPTICSRTPGRAPPSSSPLRAGSSGVARECGAPASRQRERCLSPPRRHARPQRPGPHPAQGLERARPLLGNGVVAPLARFVGPFIRASWHSVVHCVHKVSISEACPRLTKELSHRPKAVLPLSCGEDTASAPGGSPP